MSIFNVKVTEAFFDRQRVIDATDRATRRVLSKFGAFVRQRARTSIRKPTQKVALAGLSDAEKRLFRRRKRQAKAEGRPEPQLPKVSSPPGRPPFDQTGVLRRSILFSYDQRANSVVIGPTLLKSRDEDLGLTVPELLEHGGRVVRRGKFVTYEPRPYMQPAFDKELSGVDQMWKDSVK